MAKAKRRSSSSGEETKAKIVDATLQTLQEEGIVGASARAIARTGDFNQALIFYHFGSVDEAIVAAVGELSRRRLERYREPLMSVDNLTELIRVARELYENDRESGEILRGEVPPGSVVVSGNLPADDGSHSLYCAVIVKRVDEKTRAKVGINELLRDI